ncbi:STAS/SEC14 domain-containing protein [Chlamydiales bacterium]|nr:STAS/SEC14 domain-containing protein [Chlamydiales bacterium]
MLEILSKTKKNFLAIRANERVTKSDYEKTFIPKLDQLIKKYGKINVLYEFGENYEGYDIKAMIEDGKYGFNHLNNFNRIAVVGSPKWIEWTMYLVKPVFKGTIQVFPKDKLDEAMTWANSG